MAASRAVLDTLETLLAPGKRARLSPFVESTQFRVLFGETPDDARRTESADQILGRHAARIAQFADCWDTFVREGKAFAANDYSSPDFLDAYLAYYFSVNVPKAQWVLLDLVRDGRLRGELTLVDLGVGTGTTAIAVLDFLLTWGQVCRLHGEPFPVTSLQLIGLDRSGDSRAYAQRVVEAYAEGLDCWLQHRRGATPDESLLRRVRSWASRAVWDQLDLEQIGRAHV